MIFQFSNTLSMLRSCFSSPLVSSYVTGSTCLSNQVRFASKKAMGSTKNGRDSNPKYRGLKKGNKQHVLAGNILVRQVGNKFHPGKNVGCGKDFTLFAKAPGTVVFETPKFKGRKYVHIIPDEGHDRKIRFLPEVKHSKQATILHQVFKLEGIE